MHQFIPSPIHSIYNARTTLYRVSTVEKHFFLLPSNANTCDYIETLFFLIAHATVTPLDYYKRMALFSAFFFIVYYPISAHSAHTRAKAFVKRLNLRCSVSVVVGRRSLLYGQPSPPLLLPLRCCCCWWWWGASCERGWFRVGIHNGLSSPAAPALEWTGVVIEHDGDGSVPMFMLLSNR